MPGFPSAAHQSERVKLRISPSERPRRRNKTLNSNLTITRARRRRALRRHHLGSRRFSATARHFIGRLVTTLQARRSTNDIGLAVKHDRRRASVDRRRLRRRRQRHCRSLRQASATSERYLFSTAIDPDGILTTARLVAIANATSDELLKAGLIGIWRAQYDPNGVVNNLFDQNAVAITTQTPRYLLPLAGQELEATTLYVDGTRCRSPSSPGRAQTCRHFDGPYTGGFSS